MKEERSRQKSNFLFAVLYCSYFQDTFIGMLHGHDVIKKDILRANGNCFITKSHRKIKINSKIKLNKNKKGYKHIKVRLTIKITGTSVLDFCTKLLKLEFDFQILHVKRYNR